MFCSIVAVLELIRLKSDQNTQNKMVKIFDDDDRHDDDDDDAGQLRYLRQSALG